MAHAVGIDLGTTNTVVAAVRDGVAGTLVDPQGRRLIPSVVSFLSSGATLVGQAAIERRVVDPANTIYSVKRLMGRAWDEPEVQKAREKLPFELREGATGGTVVVARGESYSFPEISAFVLRHAKAVAEAALGAPTERAVITVPANFNDLQRAATKTAGRIAGLEVLRILNEPTAAALAYGPPAKGKERIAIYDLGGGTFDMTVLDLAGNVFEVIATAGDMTLGGDDIDLCLAERMADDLLAKFRFDARAQPGAFAQLRILGEQMKRELSLRDEHTLGSDDLVPADRGSRVRWSFRMTRPELEGAALALVERTFNVCQQALATARVTTGDIDRVILVGGATRMPMVAHKVEQFFGRPPIVQINPDEVVALGAAIQASLLDRSRRRTAEPPIHPRISEDSAVRPAGSDEQAAEEGEPPPLPLVGQHDDHAAPTPTEFLAAAASKPLVFELPIPASPPAFDVEGLDAGRRPPAKAPPRPPMRFRRTQAPPAFLASPPAAPGATLPPQQPRERPRTPTMSYAYSPFDEPAPPAPPPLAVPEPPRALPLLIDVTPLSLSVETVGGFCDMLIEANTPVPCDRTRAFATASDGQTMVRVRVAQGPSKRFDDNTCLGELELSGLAPAPRGEVQIAVTFEIDADGILNVRARDGATGRETVARLELVGAHAGGDDIASMQARQHAHPIA